MQAVNNGHRDRVMAAIQRRGQKARARLRSIEFARFIDPWAGYDAAHMQLIGATVDKAIDGSLWEGMRGAGTKYLFINVPPGYGKTSFISRKLPAFAVPRLKAMGRNHQVIIASYNSTLAETHNRKVLELMKSPEYKNLFPDIVLSDNEQNAEQWSLEGDPFTTCKAAGVGAGLTGYHGQICIVDDPIKDRRAASSPTTIQHLWEWWEDVLTTRVTPGGFIIGMWTRWSEDDPQGRILRAIKSGESDDVAYVLRLPALAEDQAEREAVEKMGLPVDDGDPLGREAGEPLWPQKQSTAELVAIRRSKPITWDSLYQQKPRPVGGYVLNSGNFNLLPTFPTDKNITWKWFTDWALTEKEVAPKKKNDPDYTVAALIGFQKVDGDPLNSRLVIGFMDRGQLGTNDAIEMVVKNLLSTDITRVMRSGQANVDKAILATMRKRADLLNWSIKNLDRAELKGDKMVKATPWIEMAQGGLVDVVQGPWNDWFFSEVEQFPHGAHDDGIDTVSVAIAEFSRPEPEPMKKARSYSG